MFPGFDRLFTLDDPIATRPFRARLRGDLPADPASGTVNPTLLLRGESRAANLTASKHSGQRTPSDVVWTTWGNVVLLSPRVIQLIETAGLSGWKTLTVRLTDGDEAEHRYHLLVVTGRCGPIDVTRSSREWSVYPGGRFPILRGLYFDERTWDGSDFFMEARHTGWVFTSERVADLFRSNGITNVELRRLDEVETRPA